MPGSGLPRSSRQSCATGLPGATGVRMTRGMLSLGNDLHLEEVVEFGERGRRHANLHGAGAVVVLGIAPQPPEPLEAAFLHLVREPGERTHEAMDEAGPIDVVEVLLDPDVWARDELGARELALACGLLRDAGGAALERVGKRERRPLDADLAAA